MKNSSRNQAIAMLIVGILVLLAFWWWTTRTPTATFSVKQIEWVNSAPFTLQLTLGNPADKNIYMGKRAILKSFDTGTTNSLVDALVGYPFVIPGGVAGEPPGITPDGFTISVGSLPKGLSSIPSQTVSSASGAGGVLDIFLS